MSTAASNDPAVVVATKLLSELCEALRKRADFLYRQTHRLTRVQADTWTGTFFHRVSVGDKTLCTKLLRDRLRGRFVRQCQEEIQLMRLKRVKPLFAQLSDEFRVKVLAPLGAPPPHREIDAQGCKRKGCKDQRQQPVHFDVPRAPPPSRGPLHSSRSGVEGVDR